MALGSVRKLVIRPLDPAPQLPQGFEDQAWAKLQEVVRAVFAKAHLPGGSHEEIYRLVEAVCVNGMDARLAERLQTECDGHISAKLAALLPPSPGNPSVGGDDVALLQRVEGVWRDHGSAMQTIGALFLYLDRTYIHAQKAHGGVPSLWDCSVQLFGARFGALAELRAKTLSGVLHLVDEDRRGRPVPQPMFRLLISMFSSLGIYGGAFEAAFVERTADFYRRESEELLARTAADEYLAHCERRISEEESRCKANFEACTEPKLLACVREELLKRHCDRILGDGFAALVSGHRVGDLERLYRLFEQVDALPAVRRAWGQAVKQAGRETMACGGDAEESKGVVPALIDLRARLSEVLASAFQSTSSFSLALKDAFEEFLNAGAQNTPAKLLARHADEVLRNERACGDAALEEGVERIMGIFRFLAAKDAFEAFYKRDLARRLLAHRSSSADAEALMIQRLRDECGSGFTSKLEGMFRDVDLSKALLATFAARPDAKAVLDEHNLELSVSVLTSGLWPTQPPSPDICYPPAAVGLHDMFAAFYAAQHTGRSLRWSPGLGQCTLRASYEGGARKELVVSHFQALVLLLFNAANTLSCREVSSATRIPQADLHRTLQSLALHKTVKLILKCSKGRDIGDDDAFTYNGGFTSKMYRVTVSQITAKEHHEEEAEVEQRVFEDRQHELDAAVVRIMKAQKRLTHQQLVAEVFATVRFPVQASDVKKRIESLIEREYLERDAERASTYTYLA